MISLVDFVGWLCTVAAAVHVVSYHAGWQKGYWTPVDSDDRCRNCAGTGRVR